MRQFDGFVLDVFTDEMMADVDVLRADVELMVMRKCNGGLVIRSNYGWAGLRDRKFAEDSAQPESLLGRMSNGNVLSFHGGEGDSGLAFGTPADQAAVMEEGETGHRAAISAVLGPVGVAESDDIGLVVIVPAVGDAVLASTFEIA